MNQLNDNYRTTGQPSEFNIIFMECTNCVWIGKAFMFRILPFNNITIFVVSFWIIEFFVIGLPGNNLNIVKKCHNQGDKLGEIQ